MTYCIDFNYTHLHCIEVNSDEILRSAAGRESALSIGLGAEVQVGQLGAVVPQLRTLHAGHGIAEEPRLHSRKLASPSAVYLC